MFNHNSGYNLSDIAAVTGRNNGGAFGDDNGWQNICPNIK